MNESRPIAPRPRVGLFAVVTLVLCAAFVRRPGRTRVQIPGD
jgi:hypothetical protein